MIGVLLRAVPVFSLFHFDYKYMLHAHSHFAFGGWVTPLLVWIILHRFPELNREIKFIHWRNVVMVLLISAYGMLFTFPFQGYGPASIAFSTLSMAGTFYLSYILWKMARFQKSTSSMFLKGAALFLLISAVGPSALGPIVSAGKAETPVYYNAIYTYLHFQYNGWFIFTIFAVLYRRLEEKGFNRSGGFVFSSMFIGCILCLPLSFLWNKPTEVYNIIGGAGSIVQFAGVIFFLRDQLRLKESDSFLKRTDTIIFTILVLKCTLQLLSAIPYMAGFVYSNRALIIAYLHMVLLGFVSLFGLITIYRSKSSAQRLKVPVYGFVLAFVITEIIQVLNATGVFTGFHLPHINGVLLAFSLLFPASALYILIIHPDRKIENVFS